VQLRLLLVQHPFALAERSALHCSSFRQTGRSGPFSVLKFKLCILCYRSNDPGKGRSRLS
jgi:hypothetical protein